MTNLHRKQQLTGLLTVLTILLLSLSAVSLAQGGEQPAFTGAVFTAANSDAVVEMQETRLDSDYFAANGELAGLTLTPDGLVLSAESDAGTYTSGVIHSPLASASDIVPLWDADLPPGAELLLETRLSLDGGTWSGWLPNPEAFYPVRDGQYGGNIIWVGGVQVDLQFRVTLGRVANPKSPTLRSLTLFFNDASRGPTDVEVAAKMSASSQAVDVCAKPEVVPRSDWGCPDGQNSPRRPPTYAPVTHIIIHQTETPNHTGPYQDYAGWVRSVWNYHANCLGWGDVGYNYLIDPAGVIYEGRAGGDDVIGVHDTHNRGSMGIGFLGCYGNCDDPRLSVAQPSPAMLDSAVDLFAWKLDQQEIDPHSQATYDNLPNIPVIAGGRDVTWTSSPGDNLYHQLPWLRDAVDGRIQECTEPPAPCHIKEINFDKDEYTLGDIINLTVKLTDPLGNSLGGASVTADVEKTALMANISTGTSASVLEFEDRTGDYTGVYPDTDISGLYTFKITADHPDFSICYGEAPVPVNPPIIQPPQESLVKVEPEYVNASWCSFEETSAVTIKNVSGLTTVTLELQYDPHFIYVFDADPAKRGVQVRPDGAFATRPTRIIKNEVDTDRGLIRFSAAVIGDHPIDDDTGLILIDWRPKNPGLTELLLTRVDLLNQSDEVIDSRPESGVIEINTDCIIIYGAVALQGRDDYSGVVIASSSGEELTTANDGAFSIPAGESITARYPGYLSAEATVTPALLQAAGEAGSAALGQITLLAGDLNGDNLIDIFDLAYAAGRFDTADPAVDLNGDGAVGILDLVLVAGNYQRQGPLTEWE